MADGESKDSTAEQSTEGQSNEITEDSTEQEPVIAESNDASGERTTEVEDTSTEQKTAEEEEKTAKEEQKTEEEEKKTVKEEEKDNKDATKYGEEIKLKCTDPKEKKKDENKEEEVSAGEKEIPLITTISDKDGALFAHNVIRRLHSSDALKWDDDLATGAEEWAKNLGENDSGLKHSPGNNGRYGESLFISKGASNSARTYQAVLCWYKTAKNYNFNSQGFTSSTAVFTQLVWQDTKKVGVGIAYCEEKQTTYIVARYSPPGNARHAQKYGINVKRPTDGRLPPRTPKIEDLMPAGEDGKPLSNMGNLFEVLCHWCVSEGEKTIESYSGIQNMKKDDPKSDNKKETSEDANNKGGESSKGNEETEQNVNEPSNSKEQTKGETKQEEDEPKAASK